MKAFQLSPRKPGQVRYTVHINGLLYEGTMSDINAKREEILG